MVMSQEIDHILSSLGITGLYPYVVTFMPDPGFLHTLAQNRDCRLIGSPYLISSNDQDIVCVTVLSPDSLSALALLDHPKVIWIDKGLASYGGDHHPLLGIPCLSCGRASHNLDDKECDGVLDSTLLEHSHGHHRNCHPDAECENRDSYLNYLPDYLIGPF